jgi:Kef-type K+ transport system membrane component KefB
MFNDIFLEIAIIIMTAGVISLFAYKLKQPLIIAYILTGIIVGSSLLHFTQSVSLFETLSTLGISFLLFTVGLNLNWRHIKGVGTVALASGIVQALLATAGGFFISRALHFDVMTSVFLGLGFAFSSTIIIVKLLSDKEDIDRLYGRIAVGVLIVQDLLAMMALLLLAGSASGASIIEVLSFSLLKGIAAVIGLFLVAKFIIPHLFRYAAKSQELLFLIALGWCFAIAAVLSLLGFSVEIGALLAGVTLAGTGFQHEIEAKIRPVRDFFLIIFFIVLGTHLDIFNVQSLILPGLCFSAFVLVVNPLITMTVMRVMGHHPRTAFLTGSTLGQISEFSFILITAGIAAKLVAPEALQLVTIVALITITFSSYVIAYNEKLFEVLSRILPFLKPKTEEPEALEDAAPEIVLIGYDRMGRRILPMIEEMTKHYRVLDFNPSVVEELMHYGVPVMYGDAGSEDALKFSKTAEAKMVISTIPDMAVNRDIMDYLKRKHAKGTVILSVKSSTDAAQCYALGATFVIVPSVLGGEYFATLLKKKGLGKTVWGTFGKKERLSIHEE